MALSLRANGLGSNIQVRVKQEGDLGSLALEAQLAGAVEYTDCISAER